MKRKKIIFDIDGTICNCEARRKKAVKKAKKKDGFNWKVFFDEKLIMKDKPFPQVVEMYNLLKRKYDIYFMSGREDRFLELTKDWLKKNKITGYKGIYMRKEGDYRPDTEVKAELFKKLFKKKDVFLLFDDRDCVVELWRSMNLVCFQVAEGKF